MRVVCGCVATSARNIEKRVCEDEEEAENEMKEKKGVLVCLFLHYSLPVLLRLIF